MTHTLRLENIDEHSVIQAVSEFMSTNFNNISSLSRKYLESFLEEYENNLEIYIKNKQILNVRFKVIFSDGNYQFYIEDPH